jgi:hypothetical protein
MIEFAVALFFALPIFFTLLFLSGAIVNLAGIVIGAFRAAKACRPDVLSKWE